MDTSATDEETTVVDYDALPKHSDDPSANGDDELSEDNLADDECIVKAVVGKRRVNKGKGKPVVTEYRIRWQGYDESDDTWEPEESLSCPELLKEFNDAHPDDEEPEEAVEEEGEKGGSPVPDGVYVVEKVLNRRFKRGRGGRRKVEYLVQWKDYPGQDSWEEKVNAPDLVAAYEAESGKKKVSVSHKKGSGAKATSSQKARARSSSTAEDGPAAKRTPNRQTMRLGPRVQPSRSAKEQTPEESVTEEQWEVAKILDRRQDPGKNSFVEYKIQWKGNYEATWEPEEKLQCQDLIREFEETRAKQEDDEDQIPHSKTTNGRSNATAARGSRLAGRSGSKGAASSRAVVAGRSKLTARMGTSGSATASGSGDEAILGEFVQNFGGKKLPSTEAVGGRYPLRDTGEKSQSAPSARTVKQQITHNGSGSGKGREQSNKTAKGKKEAPLKTTRGPQRKAARAPVVVADMKNYKDLKVYVMRDSEVLAMKVFKYNPEEVGDWKNMDFDRIDLPFEDEAVKVLGKLNFAEFPDEVFYMIVQKAGPQLLLGVTETFMEKRFPKTLNTLEHSSLLSVGEVPTSSAMDDDEMDA